MEDDEDTFVTIGTPLEFIDEDDPIKKPQKELQAVGVGTKARPRFHGAFTGGFSAGYFNTVGSKDGFTPSSFTSSKEKKNEFSTQRPEDFMDEEDFAEHGIAPRKFQTSDSFVSEDRKRQRDQAIKSATADTLLGSTTALADLIVPERLTIGVKLLRKMGWKEGQGLGPRYEKKAKSGKSSKDSQRKVYGCSLPQEMSEESDEEIPENVTFAPKDVNPVKIGAKDNVHGIGYRGLDPRKALPATHVSLFPAPAITKTGKKGIRGTAFGVGALEEDDEDIYSRDHLSNYDMTMDIEEDIHMGWTAPGRGKKQAVPVGYVGNLLEGFTLSGKKLPPRKIFPPPHLPSNYKPLYTFRKEDSAPVSHTNTEQDAVSRGLTLGETPVFESVFDLIPQKDKERLNAAKSRAEGTIDVQSSSNTEKNSSDSHIHTSQTSVSSAVPAMESTAGTQSSPMATAGSQPSPMATAKEPSKLGTLQSPHTSRAAVFSPFVKDPEKQRRYDQYISLVKEGNPDAYEHVAGSHMTEWEREREMEEFSKAARFYKPMTSMMASRFTRAKFHDDEDKVEMPAQEEGNKNDRQSAAKMKMYGTLTRDSYEWHPDRVVCKRFNIPDPYPGSTITGVPKVKRDKYSVFNFLNFTSNEPIEEKSVSQDSEMKALPAPETKQDKAESVSFKITAKSHPKMTTSIFSSLNEEKPKGSSSENVQKEEEARPSMDLFEAIFGNTDSEDSEEDTPKATSNISNSPPATLSQASNKRSSESPTTDITETRDQSSNLDKGHHHSGRSNSEKNKNRSESDKSGSKERTSANPTTSIFSHLFQEPQKEEVSLLPGAPVAIETLEMRLSGENRVEDSFGPELPPVMKESAGGSLKGNGVMQPEHQKSYYEGRGEKDRHRERKKEKYRDKEKGQHKDRHRSRSRGDRERDSSDRHKKHKHTKSKKSKHKKKHKKEKKSHKKEKQTVSYSSSDADSESDSDSPVSNQELLQRWRSLTKEGKL